MTSMSETAEKFFAACEQGGGWEACKQYCAPDATFSAQADALADIKTLEQYAEWMKGLFGPLPDAAYTVKAFSTDEDRKVVTAFAVFTGTNTAAAGSISPTGQHVQTDYVYAMEFDGDKIRHMTKVWNDGYALRQLGWA
jgi:predicted ester cyclase